MVRYRGGGKQEEGRYDDERANDATSQHPNGSVGWERHHYDDQRRGWEPRDRRRKGKDKEEVKEEGQDKEEDEGQDEKEDDE